MRSALLASFMVLFFATPALADPCGMVPPARIDPDDPAITRVGPQKTWVFYKDGMCDIAIHPGFSGKVEEFGMLIPFPAVPSLRKVPQDLFAHIENAIDPPPVVVYAGIITLEEKVVETEDIPKGTSLRVDEVKVLKQEAVGMYEVVVLDAGSARALKRWMSDHGYRYPEGMDVACNDYVELGWCFVAVKTRVAPKRQVDPRPGMESPEPALPEGASFDGHVQAMGFRFRTDELVVPMRLSAFNAGKLHNVVYLLADDPMLCDQFPDMVKRRIDGETLYKNVTEPLPLEIRGGTIDDLLPQRRERLEQDRKPGPKNGRAKELFAGNLLAVRENRLVHPHERVEKDLLAVGEALGLRDEMDKLHAEVLAKKRAAVVEAALEDLKGMTLTVIEGDFARETLRKENLLFSPVPGGQGTTDTVVEEKESGGTAEGERAEREVAEDHLPRPEGPPAMGDLILFVLFGAFLLLLILGLIVRGRRAS